MCDSRWGRACFLGLTLFALPVSAYADDLTQGLLAYWSFDEGSGSTAHDLSGNGNDGTIHGATWVVGVSGAGLEFHDDLAYVDASTSGMGLNNFSVSIWAEPYSLTPYDVMIEKVATDGKNDFMIGFVYDYDVEVHYLVIELDDEDQTEGFGSGGSMIIGGGSTYVGRMTHFVYTYDGSTVRFYINGRIAETISDCSFSNDNGKIIVGADIDSTYPVPDTDAFHGIIDEVRIYNRALSSSEVQLLYQNAGQVNPGPASLAGTIRDNSTGNPIGSATVTLAGQSPVETSDQGVFVLSGVPSGESTLRVTKPGYHPVEQTVTVSETSGTVANILMTPVTDFGVVEVRGKYSGPGQHCYYLDGVTLEETFTATIDWGEHTPGIVRWITPTGTVDTPCPNDTVTHTFDMGSDFGDDGRLSLIAIPGGGSSQSAEHVANFQVVGPPVGLPYGMLGHVPVGNVGLKYAGSFEMDLTHVGIDPNTIPESIPGFGGKALKVAAKAKLEAEMTGDGKAEASVELPEALASAKVGGVDIGVGVGGKALWQHSGTNWVPGGSVRVFASGSYTMPPNYVVFMVGPVPVPGYWRAGFGLALENQLSIQGWAGPSDPLFLGTLSLTPSAEVMLGVGAADILAAEGYLGGGAELVAQYMPTLDLNKVRVFLSGGVRIYVLIFKFEQPLLEYSWDLYGGEAESGPVMRPMQLLKTATPTPVEREYLNKAYAVFLGDLLEAENGQPPEETPLQINVFPQSTPKLAAVGNDLLLTWVYDDPNRSSLNRTEVVFSKFEGTAWSSPVAVADDGTADFEPQVAGFAGGDAIAAWANVKEVLPGEATLDDMKAKMEIAVAHYDEPNDAWLAATALTDNTYLDHSPRLATASNGKAMLTWVSNAANELLGTAANPNKLRFALYDGSNWSAPADIATGVVSVVKSAMAFDGTDAVLIFSGDTDGDDETTEDRELYATTYDGTTWAAVTRLTNDAVQDANPQVAYDSNGDLVIVWYSDGDLAMATDATLSDRQTIVDLPDASSGAADFRLAVGPAGQIGLLWQDTSDEGVDVWSASYDPTLSVWSKPLQLTADNSMEHALSPVFDADGDLVAAYNKVQMDYVTRMVQVGDELVQVDNVPEPNQTDLYVLRHEIDGDLAVDAADVSVSPENPESQAEATLTAVVRNLGNVPAANLDVAFYDGDPGSGGTLIAAATHAGPLVGGDSAEVSVAWTLPDSSEPRQVFVVVDPALAQDDSDRSNNTASLSVMAADLTIREILVQEAGPSNRIFTIRVANEGVLPVSNVDVAVRRDDADPNVGEMLQSFTIPSIAAGAYQDVSFTWSASFGTTDVFAVVDEPNTIDEFDETNNGRSTSVHVTPHTLGLSVVNDHMGVVTLSPDQLLDPNDDPNDPNAVRQYAAGTVVMIDAAPIEGKMFKHWLIFDPNYPGEPYYATEDTNQVLTLAMDQDYEIEAAFKCGSGMGYVLPLMLVGVLGLFVVRRRRRP